MPPARRHARQGRGVPGEVMDVEEIRPLLVQQRREVGGEPAVVEGVARQRIALGEVVDHQPHADAAVLHLQRLPQRAPGIGDAGVDGHLAPGRLAQGEPAGVDLGAGRVPGRPAVDQVEHPRGRPPARGRPSGRAGSGEHPLARRLQRVRAQEAGDRRQVLRMQPRAWRGGPPAPAPRARRRSSAGRRGR